MTAFESHKIPCRAHGKHDSMPSGFHFARSPLSFSIDEMKRLAWELDHPQDAASHTANLMLRRDFLVEQRRRLNASIAISRPGVSRDDETFRHTRLAKDLRSVDAAFKSVTMALSALGAGGSQPFAG
jgi:hypothetical protein